MKTNKIIGILTVIMTIITTQAWAQYSSDENGAIHEQKMSKEKKTIEEQQLKFYNAKRVELQKMSKDAVVDETVRQYELISRIQHKRPTDQQVIDKKTELTAKSKEEIIEMYIAYDKQSGKVRMVDNK